MFSLKKINAILLWGKIRYSLSNGNYGQALTEIERIYGLLGLELFSPNATPDLAARHSYILYKNNMPDKCRIACKALIEGLEKNEKFIKKYSTHDRKYLILYANYLIVSTMECQSEADVGLIKSKFKRINVNEVSKNYRDIFPLDLHYLNN